jgi:hypothetical protein
MWAHEFRKTKYTVLVEHLESAEADDDIHNVGKPDQQRIDQRYCDRRGCRHPRPFGIFLAQKVPDAAHICKGSGEDDDVRAYRIAVAFDTENVA